MSLMKNLFSNSAVARVVCGFFLLAAIASCATLPDVR